MISKNPGCSQGVWDINKLDSVRGIYCSGMCTGLKDAGEQRHQKSKSLILENTRKFLNLYEVYDACPIWANYENKWF